MSKKAKGPDRSKVVAMMTKLYKEDIKGLPSSFDAIKGIPVKNTLKSLKIKIASEELLSLRNRKGEGYDLRSFLCKYLMLQHSLCSLIFFPSNTVKWRYEINGIKGLKKKSTGDDFKKHYKTIMAAIEEGKFDEFLLPENSAAYNHITW